MIDNLILRHELARGLRLAPASSTVRKRAAAPATLSNFGHPAQREGSPRRLLCLASQQGPNGTLRSQTVGSGDRRGLQGVGQLGMATAAEQGEGLAKGFADSSLESFSVGILGDLHLEPDEMHDFNTAAAQMREAVKEGQGGAGGRIVQLGDLGGYSHKPGSWACFRLAAEYLAGFGLPTALVTGNHDLEGGEFKTDEDNLAAWSQTFQQRHYWAASLGPAVCIGLSTVRFRSHRYSAHEVYVDPPQLAWFEEQLQAAEGRPVVVFTHAPPLGCGLKAVEGVHVKNRCAWLNHSEKPQVFVGLVRRYPNIRLWFSGHYHLSQNYPDSIATVGGCAFVQTGVIGQCDRDGQHQSRILRGSMEGFEVSSLDHTTGKERLDLRHAWADTNPPSVEWLSPAQRLSGFWPANLAFHQPGDHAGAGEQKQGAAGNGEASATGESWYGVGPGRVLRRMPGLLVEYASDYQAAVGVVFTDVGEGDVVVLLDEAGAEVNSLATAREVPSEDGARAATVELRDAKGSLLRRVQRNPDGGFYQIFQHNKWRIRLEKEAKEGAMAVC